MSATKYVTISNASLREWRPSPPQKVALEFLRPRPRANLHAQMGIGKTTVCLALIEEQALDGVLVVGPKRVVREVWPAEVAKWRQFAHMSIETIDGPAALERLRIAPPRISTINYDRLIWLVAELRERWPFSTVIYDESDRLKGFRLKRGTRRALAIAHVAHKYVERWINLTGTPDPNGLLDLWGQQWFIDGGKALGRTYTDYLSRWFYKEAAKKGHYADVLPHKHAQKQIEKRMQPTTLALRTRDWFDLLDPVENTVDVNLPPAAAAQYQSMAKAFYAQLERGLVTAVNCGVKSVKLRQICSGAVYHEGSDVFSEVHAEKLEALDSIVSETNGANLLVTYEWKHELVRILRRFKQAVSIAEPGAVDRWNRGEIRMLLAHPLSAGHGLNLQDGGHHLVFFTPIWDAGLYAQVLERIGPMRQRQSGHNRAVYVHHILARGTVEERVRSVRTNKLSMMEAFSLAMARGEAA